MHRLGWWPAPQSAKELATTVLPLTAVVGEDSYLVQTGVVSVLEGGGIEVRGTAADLDSLRAAVARERPDVVVTDIRMPPTSTDEGVRLARELAESHPEIGVVVLSQHALAAYATEIFESGNPRRAYLLKERLASPDYLLAAIRAVVESRPQLDPLVISLLAGMGGVDNRIDRLSPREHEVLGLVAGGLSNSAIAERLFLTTRAVERHINSIFGKLELTDQHATNRRVLAALAYTRGQE
jgi:DNA-binding NarL/FixJ family response regulator